MSSKPRSILLNAADNVAVIVNGVEAGVDIGQGNIISSQKIPPGHKIAVRSVILGEPLKKYGQIIGFATKNIIPGDHVHLQGRVASNV